MLEGKKYGVLTGRYQPLHKGHQTNVDFILEQGMTPVILLSAVPHEALDTEKNPYSFDERKKMIESAYPDKEIIILPQYQGFEDMGDGVRDITKWRDEIQGILAQIAPLDQFVYFYVERENSNDTFVLDGETYTDMHYAEALERSDSALAAF